MIPAALLIIALPLVAIVPAIVLRRWHIAESLIALAACALAMLILTRPAESVQTVLGLRIGISEPASLLGRALQIRPVDQYPILLIFACAFILFACTIGVSTSWTFVPAGLGVLALISAGLMIRPFVFTALAFEAAAAVSMLMIQADRVGERSTLGASRYLIVTTLALPFFFAADYAIRQVAGITDPIVQLEEASSAILLLTIGLALLMGAFPVFFWASGVAKDAPPLATVFLATISNGAAAFMALGLMQDYPWFAASPNVIWAMRFGGVALLALGGLLAWAQSSFARLLACSLLIEFGGSLLVLSIRTPAAVESLSLGLISRAIGMGGFAIAMTLLRQRGGDDQFESLRGASHYPHHRLVIATLVIGVLSLVGLPGTIGFLQRWVGGRELAVADPEALILLLIANLSLGIGLLRGIESMLRNVDPLVGRRFAAPLPRWSRASLAAALVLVLVLGLLPGVMAVFVEPISSAYTFYR